MTPPEEALARRVCQLQRLSPPVDVDSLALKYADFERSLFPVAGVDALLVPPPLRRRPLIIVNSSQSLVRQRFSVAHELGHLLIPWHAGHMHIDAEDDPEIIDYLRQGAEAEANRFAAELLLPAEWISQQIMESRDEVDKMYARLAVAKVSDETLLIAWARRMQPGFVAALKRSGSLARSVRSPRTIMPTIVSLQQAGAYDEESTDHGVIGDNVNGIFWWRFTRRSLPGTAEVPSRSLLDTIFKECKISRSEAVSLRMHISGMIGAARGTVSSVDPEEIYSALYQRFFRDPDELPGGIGAHPRLRQFLAQRSIEISRKS